MTNNRLAIIILNWNCADDTIECSESLLAQANVIPDIIIVDNASTDDSLTKLERYIKKRRHGNIQLVRNATNAGFSGGMNRGISAALEKGYASIGTLNPDATADTLWASSLVEQLDADASLGAATGLLLKSDKKTIDTTGEEYSIWGIPGPRLRNAPATTAPTHIEYIFGTTGGGFIAKSSMFKDVGLFDERFFMYFEDVDLSFRMQLRGYKIAYIPEAVAYHKIGASSQKVPGLTVYNTFKNLPILFTKNVPLALWPMIYPRFLLSYTLILGNAIKRGQGTPAIRGWLMSWRYIFSMFRERQKIQRTRTVPTSYISSIMLHDIPREQTGLRAFRRHFTGKD